MRWADLKPAKKLDQQMMSFSRYFHIISRYVLPPIQISAIKIVTGFYEG